MDCQESVNQKNTMKLSQLTLSQFRDLLGEESEDVVKYNKVMAYCKFMVDNNYTKKTYYTTPNKKYGRQYAKGLSIQSIPRTVRGLLCDGVMHDYDMVNCAPSLLLSLCKKYNYSCYCLQSYVDNREDRLNTLSEELSVDRGTAKDLFIQCITSDDQKKKYGKKKITGDFFLQFQKEMSHIQNLFYENEDFIDTKVYVVERSKSKHKKGTLLSYITSHLENEVLEYVTKKFPCNVKMFDGFLSTENYDIDEINQHCSEKYNVKWDKKSHDLSILDDFENIELTENVISYVGESVLDVAQYLIEHKFNKIFCICRGNLYYNNGTRWVSNSNEIKRFIKRDISLCDLFIETEKGVRCVNDNMKGVNEVFDFIYTHAPEDNDLIDRIWDNSQKKIYFNNGYYDFIDGKFKNDDRDTFIVIERDFDSEDDEEVQKEIFDKILNPIFGGDEKLLNSWLYEISQCMAGNIDRKNWYCLEGMRNCGKGMLTDALVNSFGRYMGVTNSDNFQYKENSGDSAKNNSWLCGFEFVRLVYTNEISLKENGKTYIDGNKIKKFCSGGDYIQCRQNFQDEKSIRLQCSLMICCNDLPERKPTDCNERLVHYLFNSKFVGEHEKQDIPGVNYYPKDESLKRDFLTRTDVRNQFVKIILNHYNKPVTPPENCAEEMEEDSDYNKLFNLFEFTKNSNDRMSNKELESIIKVYNIPFTKSKVTRLLKSKGCQPYRNRERGLSGIKLVVDNFISDDEN
jgi:hypothetical protein